MGFGLHKDKTYAAVEKDFPDYADWCRAAHRTEPQISSHLALFVGYLEREAEMVDQASAASSSAGPVEIRDKLTKVKAELLKPEIENPEDDKTSATGSPQLRVPQWDGEESSFEAYMIRCRTYATLKKQWQEQ